MIIEIKENIPLTSYQKSRTQWKRTGAVVSEGWQVAEAGELIGYSASRGRGGAKQAIRGGGAASLDGWSWSPSWGRRAALVTVAVARR
nr:hypothetical protein Itr_chr05CG09050 [Ipomoea trifida]